MQLSAIAMSRVIAIAPPGELDPFGKVFLPGIIPHIIERYSFQKWTKLADWNPKDPFEFENGYAQNCGSIAKLMVYGNGLTIETRSDSSSTRAALEGMYEWLASDHGILYTPQSIKRWLYVTDLFFYSKADLTSIHPAFRALCDAMTDYNISIGRPKIEFNLSRLAVDFDHSTIDFPQTPFLVERDKSAQFTENRYFSESPLPSDHHIRLLEAMERSFLEHASR